MASIKYGNNSLQQLLVRKQKKLRAELRIEATETARDIANWLTVATREWTHKPRFAGRVTIRPDYIEAGVDVAGTAKKIFMYVDQGTGTWGPKKQPYEIKPKNPDGMLKFQTGYSARSAPGAKIGQGTGEHSGAWMSKKSVMHPGIEPREFTKKVLDELNPDFVTRIEDAIGRAVTA